MLRALKNLDCMSIEELASTLKVHEQEPQQDEGTKREKYLALSSQKNKKASSFREPVLRSSSKDLKVDDSSKEDLDEDELAFIAQKIHKMWRRKRGSKWRNFSRRTSKEKKDKDKSSIIFYECKKPGHFKFECPNLEKSQYKKKYFKT